VTPLAVGRRAFAFGLALAGCTDCTRRDRAESQPPGATDTPLPPMPEAGAAAGLPRGEVGTQTWTFDGDGRAVVVVPSWTKPDEKLPVLIALHGRGEAVKGPEEGVMGWPRDYALLRAIQRLCAPPLTDADLEGFSDPKRLAELNAQLADRPWKGLVVVCPYLPDLDLGKPGPIKEYGDYLIKTVLARVRRELPVLATPAATGIDGVSLGGAIALRVGLGNADAFGAVGTLQAAIRWDQIGEFTDLARTARTKNAALKLRLLTSKDDYFRDVITKTSAAWRAAAIDHEMLEVPGPHDYPFNRGPGAIEMLAWHDRVLAR
jgi:enterochelin esterase-like enzyme